MDRWGYNHYGTLNFFLLLFFLFYPMPHDINHEKVVNLFPTTYTNYSSPLTSHINVNFFFRMSGNALHSFSFAAVPYKGSFCNIPEPGKLQASMSASWQFFNYVSGAGTATTEPIVVRNPVSTNS